METLSPQDFKQLPVQTVEGGKKWIIHNPDQNGIPLIVKLLVGDVPLISVVN